MDGIVISLLNQVIQKYSDAVRISFRHLNAIVIAADKDLYLLYRFHAIFGKKIPVINKVR